MASASESVISGYDVSLRPGITSRTSYVIGQDGKVRFVHSEMDYKDHVRLTLAAVQKLRNEKR